MNRTTAGVLALAIGVLATTGTALASGFNFAGGEAMDNTAINEAIDSNDYDAWKTAMLERFTNTLTQERFEQLVEKHQEMNAIDDALESGDYAAWKAAVEKFQNRITDVITQDNFPKYVQMRNAEQSGDFETANQLREELGLSNGYGMGMELKNHDMGPMHLGPIQG